MQKTLKTLLLRPRLQVRPHDRRTTGNRGGRGRKSAATIFAQQAATKARLDALLADRRERERKEREQREAAATNDGSSAAEAAVEAEEEVVLLGEVSQAQRDAEGRAAAIDIDSEDEAIGGGVATGHLPPDTGSQLDFSQDA